VKGDKTLKKLLFSMSTLEELGEVLSSQQEFSDNIRMSLYSVMGSLPVAKGALFLYRPRSGALMLEVGRGVVIPGELRIPLTRAMAELLGRRQRVIIVREPKSKMARFVRSADDVLNAVKAEVLMPLNFRGELVGLLALGRKFSGERYTLEDFDLLTVMANYIAIGIHNQVLMQDLLSSNKALKRKADQNRRLFRNLEDLYHDTIKALGAAIDAKDPYTRGHSDRVACFSEAIAKRLGLAKNQVTAVRVASHLHDIGKIAVDNSILLKPSRLSEREIDQIHRHPTVSFDILSNIKFPYPDVALIARHHHEWVNGSGYPDRISIEKLNTGMKILGLADAFDAMTSDRPYRSAIDLEVALTEVRDNTHVQFDGQVSQALFQVLRDELSGDVDAMTILPRVRSRYSPKSVSLFLETVTEENGDRHQAG
jgi:putative nucleotidyltransferase with HDIG domain